MVMVREDEVAKPARQAVEADDVGKSLLGMASELTVHRCATHRFAASSTTPAVVEFAAARYVEAVDRAIAGLAAAAGELALIAHLHRDDDAFEDEERPRGTDDFNPATGYGPGLEVPPAFAADVGGNGGEGDVGDAPNPYLAAAPTDVVKNVPRTLPADYGEVEPAPVFGGEFKDDDSPPRVKTRAEALASVQAAVGAGIPPPGSSGSDSFDTMMRGGPSGPDDGPTPAEEAASREADRAAAAIPDEDLPTCPGCGKCKVGRHPTTRVPYSLCPDCLPF